MKSKKHTEKNDHRHDKTAEKNDLNKLIEKTRKQNKVLQKLIDKINTPEKTEK